VKRHIPITAKEEALRLAEQGHSDREVAESLSARYGRVDRSTVTRWREHAGIPVQVAPGPKPRANSEPPKEQDQEPIDPPAPPRSQRGAQVWFRPGPPPESSGAIKQPSWGSSIGRD
jgi:hypothetical protein